MSDDTLIGPSPEFCMECGGTNGDGYEAEVTHAPGCPRARKKPGQTGHSGDAKSRKITHLRRALRQLNKAHERVLASYSASIEHQMRRDRQHEETVERLTARIRELSPSLLAGGESPTGERE